MTMRTRIFSPIRNKKKVTAKRSTGPHRTFQFPTFHYSAQTSSFSRPICKSIGFSLQDLSSSPMSITRLPDRTVHPKAVQILTSISIRSISTLTISISSVGLSSTCSVAFSGSRSRNGFSRLCFRFSFIGSTARNPVNLLLASSWRSSPPIWQCACLLS